MRLLTKLGIILLVPGGFLLGAYWFVKRLTKPTPSKKRPSYLTPMFYCSNCFQDVSLDEHLHCSSCGSDAVTPL